MSNYYKATKEVVIGVGSVRTIPTTKSLTTLLFRELNDNEISYGEEISQYFESYTTNYKSIALKVVEDTYFLIEQERGGNFVIHIYGDKFSISSIQAEKINYDESFATVSATEYFTRIL